MHHHGPTSHPRITSALLLGAVATGGAALAVDVAAKPAPSPSLQATHAQILPGGTLVLHGTGFPQSAHVTLRAARPDGDANRIGSADTGRRGGFVARVKINANVPPGRYVATACHDRCRVKATTTFRVLRPSASH